MGLFELVLLGGLCEDLEGELGVRAGSERYLFVLVIDVISGEKGGRVLLVEIKGDIDLAQ